MNSILQKGNLCISTIGSLTHKASDIFFDCNDSDGSHPTLRKISKDAINLMKNNSEPEDNKIKPAPSVIILKHCRELLENHSLRKPSIWSKEPLLNADDVKLLRHIVESNERYQCLKEEDSDLLKEILVTQMSEVESQQKFLWRLLKILKDKRRNALKKRIMDLGIKENIKKVSSDLLITNRTNVTQSRKCQSDRTRSRTYEKRTPVCGKPKSKLIYEGYLMRTENIMYNLICWKVAFISNKCKVFEMKTIRYTDSEKCYFYTSEFVQKPNRVFIFTCSTDFLNALSPITNGRVVQKCVEIYNKILCSSEKKMIDQNKLNSREDIIVEQPRNFYHEKVKNSMVFLIHLILFTTLVISLKGLDFQCID